MSDLMNSVSSLPLFADLSPGEVDRLLTVFERRTLERGAVLFEAGERPEAVFLLVEGDISVRGVDEEVLLAHPPATIGELSAVTGEDRSLTAVAASDAVVLAAPVEQLQNFLEKEGAIGFRFQRTLVRLAARKIGRDRGRLREMKDNIVSTQKAMKAMRDSLLQSEDEPLHEALYEQLDALIEHNRRVHYLVEPSRLVPTSVRLDSVGERRVTAISEEWLYFERTSGDPELSGEIKGLLLLDGDEVPMSGNVERYGEAEVCVFLDELVPEFKKRLEAHLTRAQLLDVVL